MIREQMRDLTIIMKHVEAMAEELDKARQNDDWNWGDGFWAEPKIVVSTDADEPLGTIEIDDSMVKFNTGATG